jgi:hypothetical protein
LPARQFNNNNNKVMPATEAAGSTANPMLLCRLPHPSPPRPLSRRNLAPG